MAKINMNSKKENNKLIYEIKNVNSNLILCLNASIPLKDALKYVCTYIEYKDGTAMSVSNGEYVLPYGQHINKVGIKPDYEYPEQYEEGWEIEDMQLSFAITQLKLNERQVR